MKKLNDTVINEIIKHHKNNLTDNKISELVNCSVSSVIRIRKKYNLKSNYFSLNRRFCKDILLTKLQKEILCGTLLGDSSLIYPSKKSLTPVFYCEHSEKQKDYAFLLADNLNAICKERNRFDKRTNKIYKNFIITTKTNLEYIEIYNKLYINGKKCITKEFLENFTGISLCYLFMDDGYVSHNTMFLCTDAFDEQSCDNLINACIEKFDIHFKKNKHENNIRLRLMFKDREKFINLISPYIIESLKYKLNYETN